VSLASSVVCVLRFANLDTQAILDDRMCIIISSYRARAAALWHKHSYKQ